MSWCSSGSCVQELIYSYLSSDQFIYRSSQDITPPDTTITSGPSGWIGVNSATFQWTGSDNQTPTSNLVYSYKLDGYSGWSDWASSTSKSYTSLSDRSYTFQVKAKDVAGNEDQSPATRSFSVDASPPSSPNITVSGSGCSGIQNNVWQNTCRDPAFTWSATDSGSGVKDYHYYWGTSSSGSPDTWTASASFDPGAIASADSYASYYLNLTVRDNMNHESGMATFGVLYDGTIPTATLQINNGAETTNQTNINLNLSAGDTGSGISELCVSNSDSSCSNWQPYADTVSWILPALDRRAHTVYATVRNRSGNESEVVSDTITLDLYPPMPHSDNYRICADVVDIGGSVGISSTNYSLVSAIGQPWATGATANSSAGFSERAGFLASITGCLPISHTFTSNYTVTQWVVASGGNLRGSTSYRLGDTAGQPAASGTNAFSSTNYVLSSGFWAQITGTVPPTSTQPTPVPTLVPSPTPTPGPTPTPQPAGFGVSINDGNLYTDDPVVTVRAWAPNVTHVRISNDGGFVDSYWRTYQITSTWVLSTYGSYVMPRFVYVQFKDAYSTVYGTYMDDIVYDPVAPEGSVIVLGSGGVATATLWLEAYDDNSGVAEMRISDVPTMTLSSPTGALTAASWQPYEQTVEWVLTGDAIYVQFRDRAGNTSPVYSSGGDEYEPNLIYLPLVLKN